MMDLEQIARQFPAHLALQKQAMLREYLQCVILEILFESPFATQFSFLGGTCLRLVYDNTRFSEDLDFDNFGLKKLYTLGNRPRAKGRDYFDVVFLFSQSHLPDYAYLDAKMSAGTPELLRTAILTLLDHVDLEDLAADVRPFLFYPEDDRRVRYFREFWEQVKL